MSAPEPYYQDELVTLYHGDCREIDAWRCADLVLTDPPYGMDYRPLRGGDGSKLWTVGVAGDAAPFEPEHLLTAAPRCVLWGANWYADRLPASGGWIVWDKTPKGTKDGFHASHAELAWTNVRSSVRKFSLQWGGEAHGGEPHCHPTQKPVALMRWVLDGLGDVGLVADPYAGSGPVALACKALGIRYIGVELDENYCRTIAARLGSWEHSVAHEGSLWGAQ